MNVYRRIVLNRVVNLLKRRAELSEVSPQRCSGDMIPSILRIPQSLGSKVTSRMSRSTPMVVKARFY